MNFANYARLHARHQPNKVCLIERTPSLGERRTLTWKQFNDAINRTANYLAKELRVTSGDFVMHLQNNSLEWLVTYFAVVKLGATVVPLNFRFVGADIKYAADVCAPKAFILGSEFLSVVQPIQKELACVQAYVCVGDSVPDDMVAYKTLVSYEDDSESMVDVADQHNLAMMFTSGTTGRPKPVIHTHYSMQHTAIGNGMSYFVHRNDNYVMFLPLYHSGVMFVWSGFYAAGATGTVLREFKDPKWIIEAMAEEKGTDIVFVVPVAVAVLNAIVKGDINLADYDLSSWKYQGLGAQPIPFEVIRNVVEVLPGAVSNIYGITEGGGGGTFNLYPEDILRKPGSIGRPTFGVDAKIVDSADQELPPGEVGELLFKTPRMMKEYYNNPEATAENLKGGWLYTGDLAKTDDEGFFYIVDRKKDMITSGGENIYPVEIEAALMEHPQVDDVACIGAPDDRLVEAVLAIVQLKAGETLSAEALLEFASTKMARYKIPRQVIFDQVLRNATGKLMKPEMRAKYIGRKEAFQKLD